ncbi:MAG: polysaccharide biosynthesis tyrosine autokinase [Isosphaeraceae bacterium]
MPKPAQIAIATKDRQQDARKLVEDFHRYKGIIFRGWKFILICVLAALTAASIYIAAQKPTYKASSRLLVIQQGGHPVHMRGGVEPFESDGVSDDNLATHVLLLKSPVIIEQAVALSGLKSVPVGAAIGNLTVKQPEKEAKIIDLVYKSKSADEARRILDGVIESYKLFLKSNYQKNSSEVIGLITKARDELNAELKSLEQAYLEYRQKNPAYSADSTGHTFITRRLDQWEQSLNQFSARSVQLQSQLELGKKMSRQGVDPASIASTLSQVGAIGVSPQPGSSPAGASAAPVAPTNDGSYVSIARDLAEVESRRKMAELYLEHLKRESQDSGGTKKVLDREIERAFLDDPDVAALSARMDATYEQLAGAKRVARRSASDPAVVLHTKHAQALEQQYQRLWEAKKPVIEQTLAAQSNPDLGAGFRAAEAEVVTLKARESSLRDRLDQVAAEELDKLRLQHAKLRRDHGEKHPLVAQVKARIASIESRQQQAAETPGGGNNNALIDYMTQSLESIEVMRGDLQKKFDEDLALSKKAEITQLEESNLRNNLERQRTLFNSVVDQLKQARLVSDYDSVSTQTIAPTSVAADSKMAIPLLLLAMVAGVVLGSGVAFAADLLEARVRTLAEIRRLVDMPLIGVIPLMKDAHNVAAGTAGMICHLKPRSTLAESYKTTRTNLEFLRRSRQAQVLLITSPFPGDGKTTTASNLAISMANTGRRVLLIDGDLRKPSLHRMFEVTREHGFGDALMARETESIDALVQPTAVNNLDLLTTGRDVSNPAELLASERLGQFLKELRPKYDMILIDSSPLLLVTDPSIIAAVADGIILVVRISSTRRHDLDVAGEMLKTLGVPIFGMVINGVTRKEIGYGYGYGYGYGGYGYSSYRYGYGYGYGYGRKKGGPYGPTDEEHTENGNGNGNGIANGALPHDLNPGAGTNGDGNGKLGHGHDHGIDD